MSRRLFKKRKAPRALRKWLAEVGEDARWNHEPADVTGAMRDALFLEQRGLCCYCYGALTGTAEDHREHVVPRSANEHPDFDWENLSLSCEGGNVTRNPTHCDHSKGDSRLTEIHPHGQATAACARVRSDGRLRCSEAAQDDIENVLQLNREHLIQARKAAIQAVMRDLEGGARRKKTWKPRQLERALEELCRGPAAAYEPWTEQWLERRMRQGSE